MKRTVAKQKQLPCASISKLARAAQGPREYRQTLNMPEGVICFPFTFTLINNLFLLRNT